MLKVLPGLRRDAIRCLAIGARARYQPRLHQHAQVPGHCRLRQSGEFHKARIDATRLIQQVLYNRKPSRVRQRRAKCIRMVVCLPTQTMCLKLDFLTKTGGLEKPELSGELNSQTQSVQLIDLQPLKRGCTSHLGFSLESPFCEDSAQISALFSFISLASSGNRKRAGIEPKRAQSIDFKRFRKCRGANQNNLKTREVFGSEPVWANHLVHGKC